MDTSGPEHCMPANTTKEFGDYIRIQPLTPKSKIKYHMGFPQTESGKAVSMVAWRDLIKRFYSLLNWNFFQLNHRSYGM